jgi:hypothetical protein
MKARLAASGLTLLALWWHIERLGWLEGGTEVELREVRRDEERQDSRLKLSTTVDLPQ